MFGLTVHIDLPGSVILRDYLQLLPTMEQQAAILVYNTYENYRVCTLTDFDSIEDTVGLTVGRHKDLQRNRSFNDYLQFLPEAALALFNIYEESYF